MGYVFYDLEQGVKSDGIDLLLPGFAGDESITIISPHDDDGLLGAGYLMLAAMEAGARVRVIVVCDGRAGYSRADEKDGIVERRKKEAGQAYRELGILDRDVVWLDVPDFSAMHYLGRHLPSGRAGLFKEIVPLLRRWKTTRLIIPNGHREHIDHTAAYMAGMFFGPQAGDAVMAEWGDTCAIGSLLVYSVWADFGLRADRAISGPVEAEDRVMSALGKFVSQSDIISGLVEARKGRVKGGRALELYLSVDPRPPLVYDPYWEEILSIV